LADHRLPRRTRDREVPLLRPQGVPGHDHRGSDDPGKLPVHPSIPLAEQGPADRQAARRGDHLSRPHTTVHRLVAAWFRLRHSGGARGGSAGRRLQPDGRVLPDHPAARRARPRRYLALCLHPGVERAPPRERAPPLCVEADHLALVVQLRHPARHRLDRPDGRLDACRTASRRLFYSPAPQDRQRARRGRGERMTDRSTLRRLAAGTVLIAFEGTTAPAWLLRAIGDGGYAGVVHFGSNIAGEEQVAALNAQLRDAAPHPIISVDEEGGDVTRLAHPQGSPYPGNAALGAVDDPDLTERVYSAMGADLRALGFTL